MHLPDEDTEFLNAHYHSRWKELSEGNTRGLLIEDYPLPDGYTPKSTHLMLLVPDSYPGGMIDMFYFDPPVCRTDGTEIGNLLDEFHFGQQWQRWSRHYDWRPGVDNISTHVTFVSNQLKSEI